MADHLDVRTSLALGRGAVSVTGIGDLLSEQGASLSLEKGDQQALVVMAGPCRSHSATNAVPAAQPSNAFADHFLTDLFAAGHGHRP